MSRTLCYTHISVQHSAFEPDSHPSHPPPTPLRAGPGPSPKQLPRSFPVALHIRGFVPLVSVVHNYYMSLPARLSALGLGMLGALLILSPGTMQALRKRWVLVTLAAGKVMGKGTPGGWGGCVCVTADPAPVTAGAMYALQKRWVLVIVAAGEAMG